jgi:hypothetical protein
MNKAKVHGGAAAGSRFAHQGRRGVGQAEVDCGSRNKQPSPMERGGMQLVNPEKPWAIFEKPYVHAARRSADSIRVPPDTAGFARDHESLRQGMLSPVL